MSVAVVRRGEARALVRAPAARRLAARVRAALRLLDRARSSVVVALADDVELRALNRRYRGLDRATDVLSFHQRELRGESDPAGDGVLLGDIVISVMAARRQAAPRGLDRELARLAIHGLAHLLGHDHRRAAQARRMRALERRLLAAPR